MPANILRTILSKLYHVGNSKNMSSTRKLLIIFWILTVANMVLMILFSLPFSVYKVNVYINISGAATLEFSFCFSSQ